MSRLLFHGAKSCADMRYYEVQRAFQLCETLLFGSENIENISLKSKRGRGNLFEKKKTEELQEEKKHGRDAGRKNIFLTMHVKKTVRGAIITFEIDFFASERVNFQIFGDTDLISKFLFVQCD